MKHFFSSLPKAFLGCFAGRKLIWHAIAIALTLIVVSSGLDWYYFLHTRADMLSYLFFPAVLLGGILPIIIPVSMVIGGYITKNYRVRILGWAIGQAALIGSIISSIYKAVTGRIQPNLLDTVHDISGNFQWGFLRHGIFWGWPSSHTTIAFAMAIALICLFPKNKIVRCLSLAYALYIGIGVSFSIHWLSDCVAGMIIGSVIGVIVGRIWKDRSKADTNEPAIKS